MAGFLLKHLLGPSNKDGGPTLFTKAQGTVYKTGLLVLCLTTLVWTSIFLYAFFYHTYMPAISHTKAAYLQFRTCPLGQKGICSYPSANVTLTNKESLLMIGQPYKVSLELELPDSPTNCNLGMFMVCINLKGNHDEHQILGKSCRSTLFPYKSDLVSKIRTLIYAPFIFLGYSDEKQIMSVELFTNYLDDHNHRTTKAYVQIQNRDIEIYKAQLKIIANFTGIRYFMFNYPYFSAAFGFATNLFFLSVIGFLSWYKFYSASSQMTLHVGYDKKSITSKKSVSSSAASDTSSIIEDPLKRRDSYYKPIESFEKIRPDILGKAFDTEESETSKEDLGEKLQDLDDEEEEFFKPEL